MRSLQPRVRKRFCRLPVQLFLGIRRANTQCRQRRRDALKNLIHWAASPLFGVRVSL